MKLSLTEAAKLITKLSGHYTDRRALWFQCKYGDLKHEIIGKYYTVEAEDAIEFSKKYTGNKRGRKIKEQN